MKKLILLFLFLTSTIYSFAQNNIGVVTADVNVRWEASLNSKIIKTFSKGKEIIILKIKSNWSFIQDPISNKKGWIYSKFIQTNIRTIKNNANVRNSAGGRILKQISKGKKVMILQEKGSWYFIKDISNNKKGWVHSSLLSDSNNSPPVSIPDLKGDRNNLNESSSIQIIEAKMRKMGLYNKWLSFNKEIPGRYYVSNINKFFNTIYSYIGVPYSRNGGASRSGIDCSGLIYKGLKSIGYTGQRLDAQSVAKLGKFIAKKESLKKGDLICFTNTTGSNKLIQHIGVYAGNNKFIHSSSSKGVISSDINDPYYWHNKFIFGVRLTKN